MYAIFKRLLDIVVAASLILLLSPMFILVILGIRLSSSGSIFYTQERLGFRGRVFKLYKFRSMTNAKRDLSVQVHQGSDEITAIGHWIRRFKIDELPQLLNVLSGDMSLVGPRPCLPSLQASFNSDGHRRLEVRPGLTGLAQVRGNIYLDWPERWQLDRQYVDDLSLVLDIKILFRTVLIVILGEQWGKK
ncbi:sugar transferase [Oceanospirillum sanctuarii]|uniref:sugar transferase n=1 Tax=Oceanospirillum sanctuarii TaxID=1434821 RepID=UPI000A3D596D|nr:sugar transferase [Oceanospirillum sanctuarii]